MSSILLVDTAAPSVQIAVARDQEISQEDSWSADRRLSVVLSKRISELLERQQLGLSDLAKIIVHAGPGGFTTLRIGVTTANALGYALGIPVVGVMGPTTSLHDLFKRGEEISISTGIPVIPVYDRPPHIT